MNLPVNLRIPDIRNVSYHAAALLRGLPHSKSLHLCLWKFLKLSHSTTLHLIFRMRIIVSILILRCSSTCTSGFHTYLTHHRVKSEQARRVRREDNTCTGTQTYKNALSSIRHTTVNLLLFLYIEALQCTAASESSLTLYVLANLWHTTVNLLLILFM